MIAGCPMARGAESIASQDIDCSVVGCTEGSVAVGIEYFMGAFLVGFTYHHPSPLCALPHSYKWGNGVPMSISW